MIALPFQQEASSGGSTGNQGAGISTPQTIFVTEGQSDKLISNGGTQAFLTTYTFPAASITANSIYRVSAGFTINTAATAANTGSSNVAMFLGTTQVHAPISGSPTSAAVNYNAFVYYLLVGTAIPGASAPVIVAASAPTGAVATTSPFASNQVPNGTSQLVTTGPLTMSFKFTCASSNTQNYMVFNTLVVEQLN